MREKPREAGAARTWH